MTKKIIVLVDLSEFSKQLLYIANTWAKRLAAELLVVHQTFSAAPAMGDPEIRSKIGVQSRREAITKLAGFVAETKISGANIKFHVTTSNLDTALLKLKTTITADIIVVGIKSKNWLERLVLGDTATKLINELNNTIIAIPDLPSTYDLSTLHVAIKQKYPLNDLAFRNLVTPNDSRVKVNLISVVNPTEDEVNMREYIQSLCAKYSAIANIGYDLIVSEDTFSVLKEYMSARQGLLVIQKGSRNLSDIFRRYFVNDAISYAQFPVVVLPSNTTDASL
jgi:nucleotide-binding universal stress UspA family protein